MQTRTYVKTIFGYPKICGKNFRHATVDMQG